MKFTTSHTHYVSIADIAAHVGRTPDGVIKTLRRAGMEVKRLPGRPMILLPLRDVNNILPSIWHKAGLIPTPEN